MGRQVRRDRSAPRHNTRAHATTRVRESLVSCVQRSVLYTAPPYVYSSPFKGSNTTTGGLNVYSVLAGPTSELQVLLKQTYM